MSPTRFYDPHTTLNHYRYPALVRCPRCDQLAHNELRPAADSVRQEPQWRLICRSCGLSRVRERGDGRRNLCDPPLWLQAGTRHGTVWAYNLEHLTLLRDFVAADLREHAPWYEGHHRRMTYIGRLPTWLKSAKNRREILRTIDRLRASVS